MVCALSIQGIHERPRQVRSKSSRVVCWGYKGVHILRVGCICIVCASLDSLASNAYDHELLLTEESPT
jgi:hypothetical protein